VVEPARRFRLWLYVLIVFGVSWPFMFIPSLIAPSGRAWSTLAWNSITMLMVAVGTFIAGRWVFRDGFRNVGWRWGNASSWALALGLPLLFFAVPAGLDVLIGARKPAPFSWTTLGYSLYVVFVGPILGFGEEFGWRGYLLPRQWWLGPRRALVVNGIIWWAWHWPTYLIPFILKSTDLGQVLLVIAFGSVGLICTGFIFSYIWLRSESIIVVSVFHGAFDAVRNLTFYWLVGVSQWSGMYYTLAMIGVGLLFLWRGRWVLPAELGGSDSQEALSHG
jgi:membrane protease YdiL (CAAX protease family)